MNRLQQASSPYLLQHADNPVDWFPWGQEALQIAKEQDKPIFLSVGYAACHWCHVMAHESFEDPETAQIMNEHFVNIKVDREERPDLDSIYMDAVVAMTGQGGWPMSVFLTPEGEPFFGGTYFPPTRRHGLPAFRELLLGIAQSWQEERGRLLATGSKLADHLRRGPQLSDPSGELSPDLLDRATSRLHDSYDWSHGGWGRAPKFPQAGAIEFLYRRHRRAGDNHARDMALHALRAMAEGGIHDQLAGGFHRYAVDRAWQVPHFEKMLYDNALLLPAYLRGWQISGDGMFRQVAERCFDFLQREMRHERGGYASSLDADSEGQEGAYYVWKVEEIEETLEDSTTSALFIAAYGITGDGNFEGSNVLYRARTNPTLAQAFALSEAEVEQRLASAQESLLERRQDRPHPPLDDKILTAWNSFLLRAFAIGAQATGEPHWLAAAQSLARFLLDDLLVDGQLHRSWREGQARFNAYLEDQAALGLGLLELYAVDHDGTWYRAARERADDILARYRDPQGGFFDTADDHEQLLARPKSLQDSPTPSGNSLATALLQRLAALTGQEEYQQAATTAIYAVLDPMVQHPTAFACWLSELDFALGPQLQLALIGDRTSEDLRALASIAHRRYLPNLVIAGGAAGEEGGPELLAQRSTLEGQPAAYLCQGFTCQRPTSDPDELRRQLEAAA